MGFTILVRWHIYIESTPWSAPSHYLKQHWNIVNWTPWWYEDFSIYKLKIPDNVIRIQIKSLCFCLNSSLMSYTCHNVTQIFSTLTPYNNTVNCRYNAVQYNTMLPTSLQCLWQSINQSLNAQNTSHTSPLTGEVWNYFVRIWEKIDRVITAPHCIVFVWGSLSWRVRPLLANINLTRYLGSVTVCQHRFFCPACRTTLVATRFRVAVICPIIQVPHCIRVFFYFVWFVFINHIFQFYYELCTYCNILDIYLS